MVVHGSEAPISKERVEKCLSSAEFWVDELPRYADRQQQRADSWAIAAGALAALTGLAIFPVASDASSFLVKAIVSLVAFMAAVCALIPRVKNYAELAGQARELQSRYGSVVGKLLDLTKANPLPQEPARTVVGEFESIKQKKDALRGLPDRTQVELRQAGAKARLAAAHKVQGG